MSHLKAEVITREALGALADQLETPALQLNRFMSQAAAQLNGGLLLEHNLAGVAREFQVTMPSDWRALTLGSGWVRHSDTEYAAPCYRHTGDWVELDGRVAYASGTPTSGSLLFKPPTGFEPASKLAHYASGGAGAFVLRVGAGDNRVEWTSGASSDVLLSGVRWRPKSPAPPPPGSPFPLVLALGRDFPGKPKAVIVLGIFDNLAGAVTPLWEPSQTNGNEPAVKILHLPGLAPTKSYTVRLLITAG